MDALSVKPSQNEMDISRFSSSGPPDDNLSISQCKLLTHPNQTESPILLNPSVFGPKLSILNRKSIESNYKLPHTDSLNSLKEHRPSFELSLHNAMSAGENKRSISNSLNCTKNNLHIDTSDQNPSEDSYFQNFMNDEKKPQLGLSSSDMKYKRYERYLDNIYVNIFITLITVYALFASDIQSACFTASEDFYFDVLTLVVMGIFFIEIILSFILKKNYRFSFFFWLDLISTVSLLLDVTYIQDAIFLGGSTNSTSKLARASRASRLGTRASRVIRMLRLIRIVKLYKSALNTKNQGEKLKSLEKTKTKLLEKKKTIMFDRSNSLKNGSAEKKASQKWYISPDASPRKKYSSPKRNKRFSNFHLSPSKANEVISIITPNKERISVTYSDKNKLFVETVKDFDEFELLNQIEEEISLKESKVGRKLSDLTIKRIIIIVLSLLLLIPLMQVNYWFDPTRCHELGINEIANIANQTDIADNIVIQSCVEFINNCGDKSKMYPMIYFSSTLSYSNCSYSTVNLDSLRVGEKLFTDYTLGDNYYVAVLDFRYNTRFNAVINILKTCFICFLLTLASLVITRDANDLVILPIERLIQKVNKLAENPLSIKDQRLLVDQDSDKKELVVIENSIIKITTLLALGYGEAGSEIIAQQMAKTGGQLDCSMKGKRVYGVFGFCDIRNFTDATEVLQQDVMIFVNNIADIVHSMVDRYGGSANKNIGDAFLLVWKFSENLAFLIEDGDPESTTRVNKRISNICDLALIAFCKIIAKINREPKILHYRNDLRLCQRINGYKVKMGFGLHLGWAIEGAIGSTYKIDASYLSPHVNIASRLEAATKQYGVPFLISEHLHRYFSPRYQTITRQVDCVTLKGSKEAIGLFTIDLSTDSLPPSKNKDLIDKEELFELNFIKKNAFLDGIENEEFSTEDVLDHDKSMKLLLKEFNIVFHESFKLAMEHYISGNWKKAEEKLTQALSIKENDGPSKALMAFMGKFSFLKPDDWKGYRELTDK